MTTHYILNQSPNDIISKVHFADKNYLLASSWDKSVYIYNIEENKCVFTKETECPLLDCSFYIMGNHNMIVYGGLSGILHYYDVVGKKEMNLGKHQEAIRGIRCHKSKGIILTGSWDKSINLWNLTTKQNLQKSINLSEKIYAMDASENLIAASTSDLMVYIFDLRKLDEAIYSKSSPLASQTRSLAILPNEEGIVIGSTEGKVAVEYLIENKNSYTFKCHRIAEEDKTIIFPVNSLHFHPKFGTLATGGSDASICLWNLDQKKRISKFQLPTSILSLGFNIDGNKLALASSYNTDNGIRESDNFHKIIIHNILETDAKLP